MSQTSALRALYQLTGTNRRGVGDIWLINNSDEPITEVKAALSGATTTDLGPINQPGRPIEAVTIPPGGQLRIGHLNGYYELDSLIQVEVEFNTEEYGQLLFRTIPTKGQVRDSVLLYTDGSTGQTVRRIVD